MRQILSTQEIMIPAGVTVAINSRDVKVTGPRGTLERSFKFIKLDLKVVNNKKIRAELWFGNRKGIACIRSIFVFFI